MKIGMAGTGRMGAAIAQRLAGRGHQLTVWNRTADKARALGLDVADSATRLAEVSETLISILTDAAALESVYGQLLAGNVKGKLFIEMSTVRPETEKRLAEKVKAKGAAFVECPVGGTVGPAKEGKLFGVAGGEAAGVGRAHRAPGPRPARRRRAGGQGPGTPHLHRRPPPQGPAHHARGRARARPQA